MTKNCFASCSSWKMLELTQPPKACNTDAMENKLVAHGGGVLSFSPPTPMSPPFYSKKAHTLNLFLRRVFHSPSYFPYRSLRLRSSESKVRGITHIHKCSYIPILCFISLVVCLTTQQNLNLCSKVHVSLY